MRVLVIAGSNIRVAPYTFLYLNVLKKNKHNVTLAYWDRDCKPDVKIDKDIEVKKFSSILDDSTPKVKKIKHFIKFHAFLKKIIKKNSFDFVIVLDTQFAVLIKNILLKKYKNRYIFDMRDPSYEHFAFYRKIVAKLVCNSRYVFISSEGYREFLPHDERIVIVHNLNYSAILLNEHFAFHKKESFPLELSFWGVIRDIEINKKIINIFKNDPRFTVVYRGTMNLDADRLKKYCEDTLVNNVIFTGEYLPDDRLSFAKTTNIVLNVYSNHYHGKNPCMGNKYYDGLLFHIPQLCMKGSYMGEKVFSDGLGVLFDEKLDADEVKKRIISFYNSLDPSWFNNTCDILFKRLVDEQNKAIDILNSVFHSTTL